MVSGLELKPTSFTVSVDLGICVVYFDNYFLLAGWLETAVFYFLGYVYPASSLNGEGAGLTTV